MQKRLEDTYYIEKDVPRVELTIFHLLQFSKYNAPNFKCFRERQRRLSLSFFPISLATFNLLFSTFPRPFLIYINSENE